MYLKTLNLKNFRNYTKLNIDLNSNINIIYGNNAQGKTNLLESIYYLAMTHSHRLSNDEGVIKYDTNLCKIKGIIKDDKIKTALEIIIQDKNKILKIDNNEIKKINDYINYKFDIIIFYPEDLDIIKGSPMERREFINSELIQISNNYYKILNDYNKLLKIRNDLLKKIASGKKVDESYFKIITEKFIDKAVIIYRMRSKFIFEINQYCEKIYKNLAKINSFEVIYQPNIEIDNFEAINIKNILYENFKKSYEKELILCSTMFGPHRDEFIFSLDGKNIKEFGSQGQQRMAILSVKLAEINIFEKYKGHKPTILLDDVFSELDDIKKNNLLKYLKKDMQVVITTTDLKKIDKKKLGKATIFKIQNGEIIKLEELE